MVDIIHATEARKVTNIAVSVLENQLQVLENNKWLKDLEIINTDLDNIITNIINDAIKNAANEMKYSVEFIISTEDISYADKYFYYTHIILSEYSERMVETFVDKLKTIIEGGGYHWQIAKNNILDLCPKLQVSSYVEYYFLSVDWLVDDDIYN
jgi:hypothetical protein